MGKRLFKINYCLLLLIALVSQWTLPQVSRVEAQTQTISKQSPCPRAFKVNTQYQFAGTLHFVCLEATQPRPTLKVVRYFDQREILVRQIDEYGSDQLTSFVDDEGTLRILLSEPNRVNGTSMYSVDRSGRFVEERHTINTQFVSAMTAWKLELNFEWQLAIANQPTYEPLFSEPTFDFSSNLNRIPIPEPRPVISLLSWRSTYFDSYQRIHLPYDGNVNKLEPMHINGQEFLIVAMDSTHLLPRQSRFGSAHPNTATESLIYRLDYGDGNLNWVHFQNLNTRIALDVKSFTITHQNSPQQDYYIALLGQIKSSNSPSYYLQPKGSNREHQYGLIIYKYLGDQFLSSHSIPAPRATKLDAITYGIGNSYILIGILSEYTHQFSLYLFDGLNLKLIPSPTAQLQPAQNYNLPMGNNFGPEYHHSSKARRTIEAPNLHLFLAPATDKDTENGVVMSDEANTKRDFIPADPQVAIPILALSKPDEPSYDYADRRDKPTNKSQVPQTLYQISIGEMIKQEEEQQTRLTSGSTPSSGNEKRDNVPGHQLGQDLLDWCRSTMNSLIIDNFDTLSQQLQSLPHIDQHRPIELHGDLVIEDDLHVSNLLYVDKIVETNSTRVIIDQEVPMNFSHTFEEIRQTHFEIDVVKKQVDQILVDDGSVQDVFNPMTFDTLVLECLPVGLGHDPRVPSAPHTIMSNGLMCPHIDNLQTRILNNRDISDIQQKAHLTGRSMTIYKDVRFEHLILRGQVDIRGTLNGLSITDLVFKRGPPQGPIVAHKTFKNKLYSQSKLLVDSWNGIRVDRLNYLTSTGDQRIESSLRFKQIILGSPGGQQQVSNNLSSRIERINGLHLDAHLQRIALANSDNNFEVPLHFEELILDGPVKLTEGSLLSSIDIENWWRNAMFKQSNQNISAPIIMAGDVHISYGGNILVKGLVNGIQMVPEHIVMRDKNYFLPNPVIFEHDVLARELELEKALNGIQVVMNFETRRNELALLYDGGSQFISGDKVLGEIHLGGQSYIGGNINGQLNLSQLYNLANNNGAPHRFSNIRLTAPLVRVADMQSLHIDSTVNGVPTNDICALAIKASQASTAQYQRLKFDQNIKLTSLRCASINGFSKLSNSFMTRYGDQHVSGTIKLANGAIFNTTVNIRRSLNGLSVQPLARAIASVVNETRTGHKTVYGDFVVNDLVVNKINDLATENVFETRSDVPQLVKAPMIFNRLDIESVIAINENLYTHTFNGLNVSDILSNTLQYDTPQVIFNHVELNTLQLLPEADLRTNSLNGYDIKRLFADSVLKDVPQQILGTKIFRAPIEFTERVFLRHGLDGLTEDELRFNMLLHSDELIEGDLEFGTDVTVKKELEIQSSLINDIDIKLFVDSMLYENRQDKRALRVAGNGSVRFKDVQLNNLVVAGTIQGVDLSKDGLQRGPGAEGSYQEKIRELQASINNNRILNRIQDSKVPFVVQSSYQNKPYYGNCFIHSCPQSTVRPPGLFYPPPPAPMPVQSWQSLPRNQSHFIPYDGQPVINHHNAPLIQYPMRIIQQLYPKFMPQTMSLVNLSAINTMWKPNWPALTHGMQEHRLENSRPNILAQTAVVDPKLLEHRLIITNQMLKDLARRINKFLSISFYYEIAQKQPLLGPLLHAASNPIASDQGSSVLLLKSTVNKGEPCARYGQTIAVMAQRSRNSKFEQDTRILETSNPTIVDSLVVGSDNYIFVLDAYTQGPGGLMSQLMVYLWDKQNGMYSLMEAIQLDGAPIAMKAFTWNRNQLACVALANPGLIYANITGPIIMHCQQSVHSSFSKPIVVPMKSVFDLDVITTSSTPEILIASLSQRETEHVGDMHVFTYNILTRETVIVATRRLVSPLKLRFVRILDNIEIVGQIQLVVSEAITSNHDTQALTRVYSIKFASGPKYPVPVILVQETQVIRDGQFYDIQSVPIDRAHSLLFLQSLNSISIYAPSKLDDNQQASAYGCDSHYSLIQRLPTKGANKFLVFSDHLDNPANLTASGPYNHFMVLSKDLCEHQQYSTMILKSRFT